MASDSASTRLDLDPTRFADKVRALPERLAALALLTTSPEGLPTHDNVVNVVVLAAGDNAIDGALVAAVVGPQCPVPIIVHQGYEVPSFVDASTLVIAVSTSGNSAATGTALDGAFEAGAAIAVIAGSGPIIDRAVAWDVPRIELDSDVSTGRALPGVAAIPVLMILDQVGLYVGGQAWVELAINQLRARRADMAEPKNDASALAAHIGRTMPLIYGGGDIGDVTARWWKSACNQGAKLPAFANVVPRMCHDELAGFGQNGDVTRQVFTLVLLRHDDEHPQVSEQFERLPDLLDEVVSRIETVTAKGEGDLAQLLDLAYVGQFVSLELAAIAGVDPGLVPIIDELAEAIIA